MDMHKKLSLAGLALALSCGPMLAQDGPRDPAGAPGGAEMMAAEGPGGGEGFVAPDGPDGPGGPRRMDWGGGRGWGQHRGGFERGGHGRREFGLSRILSSPEMQQRVGVSADQVAKIRQQETAFRKTSIQQRADLQVKQIDLRDLMSAEKPDRAAIDRKLQEISASRLAMDKSRVDFRLNMKDALTPEQREKLKQAIKEKREARSGQRRGPGGQRGPRGPRPNGPAGGQAPPANPGE